jgi:hypothetical protein
MFKNKHKNIMEEKLIEWLKEQIEINNITDIRDLKYSCENNTVNIEITYSKPLNDL